VLRKFMKML